MSKFDSIYDVIENSQELDVVKQDIVCSVGNIQMVDNENIAINGVAYPINKLLLQQLFNRMALASKSHDFKIGTIILNYLFSNKELLADNVQYHLNKFVNRLPNTKFLARLSGDRLRALLSDDYSICNNTYTLNQVNSFLENSTFDLSKIRVLNDTICNEDYLILKLLFDDYDENGLGIGISTYNNEIGKGSVRFQGLVKRGKCDNTIITSGNIRFYHRGNIYQRLEDAIPQIIVQLENARLLRDKFIASENIILNRLDLLIPAYCKKHNLSDKIKEQMFEGTEGQENVAAFINAITHGAKLLNPEDRINQEELAGDLIWFTPEQLQKEYQYIDME